MTGIDLEVLAIARKHAAALFDELEAHSLGFQQVGAGAPTTRQAQAPLHLAESPLTGTHFVENDRSAEVTFAWPDSTFDAYDTFVSFAGVGGRFDKRRLALGYRSDGGVVGFVLGSSGGSKRGLVTFEPIPGDHARLASFVRGFGPTKMQGYPLGATLPTGYQPFSTGILGELIPGRWMRQAVVVDRDDVERMLLHTAIQAELRGVAQ